MDCQGGIVPGSCNYAKKRNPVRLTSHLQENTSRCLSVVHTGGRKTQKNKEKFTFFLLKRKTYTFCLTHPKQAFNF